MTMIINAESLTQSQSQCTHGDVRLVGTLLRSQGIVEICIDSHWGRVCRDHWGNNDAAVVCNQLGFGRDGNNNIITGRYSSQSNSQLFDVFLF